MKQQNTKVVTGKVRFSYVNVFNKKAIVEGQEPKYSVCVLIPKTDTKTLEKINKAIEAAKEIGKNLWGGKVPLNLKTPIRDGDIERSDQIEFKNHYFLNATTKIKPGIVDINLNEILDENEIYSGCYGRVSINFYPFNQAGNKGIGCGLLNLQKLEDGEMLGGRARPEDDFADDDILG